MSEMIAQALMVWLEAVLAEIPVWSGASRATFVKLAQQIGYDLPVGPATGNWAHGLFDSRMDRTAMGMAQSDGKLTADKDDRRVHLHLQYDAAVADLERVPQRQRRSGPEPVLPRA